MRVAHKIEAKAIALFDETYTCDRSIFSLPFSIRVRSYVYDEGSLPIFDKSWFRYMKIGSL
jgi:hypothetical protein